MSEFDKHWDTHCISSNCEEDEAKIHFEAGQQSQQAKIDLLEVQLKGAEERAKLTLDHKNRMVDELQMSNHHLSVQFSDSNTYYDHVKKERDELQARVDEALIEMKNQLGDEDFCDMQRPEYDAMLYALRNIKGILEW